MIKVGIVGGTGYTGVELLRLLAGHPEVELEIITSRGEAGSKVSDMFPNLRETLNLTFKEPDLRQLGNCDVVFFATPNGTAMTMAPKLLETGTKVIDLAADFRLEDAEAWQQWYGVKHACPNLLQEAIYGLPELNRMQIANARLVANPGCYPTAVTLGLIPLLENRLIEVNNIVADAKSGVSGAGRSAKLSGLLCEASENFKAYGIEGHRHLPEIQQTLKQISGEPVSLTFVPHLIPMIRGIEASIYAILDTQTVDLQQLYEQRYAEEPFVDIMPSGTPPETRSVKGANMCRISVSRPQQGRIVVISSVIDNLVKGAAGQAVQNMNIMFGLDETAGLQQIPTLP